MFERELYCSSCVSTQYKAEQLKGFRTVPSMCQMYSSTFERGLYCSFGLSNKMRDCYAKVPDSNAKVPDYYGKVPDCQAKMPGCYVQIANCYVRIPDAYGKMAY